MIRKAGLKKYCLIISLTVLALAPAMNAFAWDHHDGGGHHDRYRYHGGRFYRPSWFGFNIVVDTPPTGAFVDVLPFGYRTIVVSGRPYYCYNNVYYVTGSNGYMVVPAPAITPDVYVSGTETEDVSGNAITINVPNSDGSFTPVMLVRSSNGYVGPQGEYYQGHPSVAQLKALYGR